MRNTDLNAAMEQAKRASNRELRIRNAIRVVLGSLLNMAMDFIAGSPPHIPPSKPVSPSALIFPTRLLQPHTIADGV
jgi:hypothetical protein